MRINTELAKLKSIDLYAFMLFALYKIQGIPEYSTISELAYVLDKENLLKLCEYFGGWTIKIPTTDELESIVYALILYQYVDIDKMPFEQAIKIIGHTSDEKRTVKANYLKIKEILNNYELSERQKDYK